MNTLNQKSVRLQPSFSSQAFDRFKELAETYGWGKIRSDAEAVRLALLEWTELRRVIVEPIPKVVRVLGGAPDFSSGNVSSVRLQVSLTSEEYEEFRQCACEVGWARVPEALMARLALLEWCDIRELTMKKPAEITNQLKEKL